VSYLTKFDQVKLLILKNDTLTPVFETLNGFKYKSHQYQVCQAHQDLHLLFWLTSHLTKFE
jgi:hypothetical protein